MRIVTAISLFLMILLAGCRDKAADTAPPGKTVQPPEASPANPTNPGEGYNRFALDLHRHLPAEGNLFYSPAGIHTALTLAWSGARGGTSQEMIDVLHLVGDRESVLHGAGTALASLNTPDGPTTVTMANRLWSQEGFAFNESFLTEARDHFAGGFEPVDFRRDAEGARQRINAWVSEKTYTRIPDLLPPGSVNDRTRLALTNAVHFLGPWKYPFKEKSTKDRSFHTPDGTIEVPTMALAENFHHHENQEMALLGMPYEGDVFDFVVILPHARDGLPALEKSLTLESLDAAIGAMTRKWTHVELPKLAITQTINLGTVLPRMGLVQAFDPGRADFTGMTEGERLFLDAAIHKSFLEVDEEGTEAAAATGLTFGVTSMPPSATLFKVDRPFLMLIRHRESGVILFMGRVTDP